MISLSRGSHRDEEAPAQTVANVAVPALISAATPAADASGSPSSRPPEHAITVWTAAPGRLVPLTWNLTQATDWDLSQTTDWDLTQATGRNLRQAKELTPS